MDVFKNISKRLASFTAASNLQDGVQPPKLELRLFDLPQEIQDMIFDYACPTVHDFRPIYRCVWDEQEMSNRKLYGPDYIYRAFSPKVAQYLVSRQFFLAAANAFIGNQEFFDADQHLILCQRHSIIAQFMSEATVDLHAAKYLLTSPKLGSNISKLTIKVTDYQLEIVQNMYPCEEGFIDDDFKTIFDQSGLEHLRRLKEYYSAFSDNSYTRSQAQVDVWNDNMRSLEEYVRAHVGSDDASINHIESPNGVMRFLSSMFPQKKVKLRRQTLESCRSLEQVSGGEMTLAQLPTTAGEMTALCRQDGEKVMRLIARLKAREQQYHHGMSSESTLVQL